MSSVRRTRITFAAAGCLSVALALTAHGRAANPLQPGTFAIAAASDLQSALPVITARFEKDTGQKATNTFGSSGNFFTQIQNGAPFDVFLSADVDYATRLGNGRLAEPGTLYRYATGRIVLWTRKDSGIDVGRGLAVLTDARVHRIAVANPEHAPYGRAAVAALGHEGLYERVQPKLVFGENISQAAQFAQSGSADVGVLALALALAPALRNSGTYAPIPDAWYPPIEQAAVVLASSQRKAVARQFIDYLKAPTTAATLRSFGFAVPSGQP